MPKGGSDMTRKLMARAAITLMLMAGAVALPGSAVASPGNDAFASATAIDGTALPFSDSVDIGSASTEFGEPQVCYFSSQTVWYTITSSTSKLLKITASGLSDSLLNVYRQNGSDLGGLSHLACGAWGSQVTFTAEANVTYYVQAARIYGGGGTLGVTFEEILPPANDDFSNAAAVGVPFSGSVDTTVATVETGEPTPSCGYGQSAGTAWYAFTPSVSGSYSAAANAGFWPQVAAYTGVSLGSLSQVGCQTFGNLLTFHADAGQTVYLQVGGISSGRGSLTLNITVAPDPVVQLNYNPGDPSIFETVQFCDYSYDPGNVGIQSRSWDFGDGSGATDQCPNHRYASDKTYTVTLRVTTTDGRSKSLSRELIVKTHDISIAKVGVPQTGTVGQSRQITVGLVNTRYAENVQVVLYKSVAGGGWQQVGALTQWVPVRGPSRTTNFAFSYTFAPEDAVLGKITFQAVAVIQGARDAISTDNSYISLSTKVNG
jgi:PKD repeat protein